jgi:enterochelin esterase-like enzyme
MRVESRMKIDTERRVRSIVNSAAAGIALLAAAQLCAQDVCAGGRPYRKPSTASPRIAELRKQIGSGNASAASAFWAELAQRGAPLIEPVPGTACDSLVTFVWKAEPDTRNVAVVGGIDGAEPAKNQMIHLAGTEVWYLTYEIRNDARFSYAFSPNDSLVALLDPARDSMAFKPDPLNPKRLPDLYASYVELPSAPREWITPVANIDQGKLMEATFNSSIRRNQRQIWVYTPARFNPSGERYPLLVLLDGGGYISSTTAPAPPILDNLIAQGKIPPVVAILVGNTDRVAELECSASFSDLLAEELVPWAREKYHATADAGATIVAGSSLGGLAASYAGLAHPEIFGNVLSMSGSYWWTPPGDLEPEWLTRQFARSSKLPVRMFVAVGSMEEGANQLVPNRHLRDVLAAKGYSVEFREFNGIHGYLNWRGSLADGLSYLLGRK